MPSPASVPGRVTAVSPGYGSAPKALLPPTESSWAWAVGPPPSTGASVTGPLGITTLIRVPSADAVAVNEGPLAALALPASAPTPSSARPAMVKGVARIVELYND